MPCYVPRRLNPSRDVTKTVTDATSLRRQPVASLKDVVRRPAHALTYPIIGTQRRLDASHYQPPLTRGTTSFLETDLMTKTAIARRGVLHFFHVRHVFLLLATSDVNKTSNFMAKAMAKD